MSQDFIARFGLEPYVGGGSFYASYQSPVARSGVHYLSSNDFLAWHRFTVDSILHFYSGDSCTIHRISKAGELMHVNLGDPAESDALFPQVVIPAGSWLSIEVDCDNTYSLFGQTIFSSEEDDAAQWPSCQVLLALFPQHQDIINRLTRE